jgi:hypothetical protein
LPARRVRMMKIESDPNFGGPMSIFAKLLRRSYGARHVDQNS